MQTEVLRANLRGLCEIYDKTFTPQLWLIWERIFHDFTDEEFNAAVKRYLISQESAFFPKPGQIYSIARPEIDAESEASLLAERLFQLIGTCGGDAYGCERAKSQLSDVVWAYIENRGGWAKFARDMQTIEESDVMTAKSQARKAIMGLIDRNRSGMQLLAHSKPGLTQIFAEITNHVDVDQIDERPPSGKGNDQSDLE